MPERLSEEDVVRLAHAVTEGLQGDPAGQRRSQIDRWASPVAVLLAILSLVFSAGISWSRISDHDRRIQDAEKLITQMQSSVSSQDKAQAVMGEKLDRIQQTVSVISGKLDGQRR